MLSNTYKFSIMIIGCFLLFGTGFLLNDPYSLKECVATVTMLYLFL